MSSKLKKNGCRICKEIRAAASGRGQSVLEFFMSAHAGSQNETDQLTKPEIIALRASAFEKFCETHTGPYTVPDCVIAHVRRVGAVRGPNLGRRRDDRRNRRERSIRSSPTMAAC